MAKKKAAWTVMVYLAGDNNLSTECLFALTEMKKAAPGEHINVIAQFDPRDEYLPSHRYLINRNGPSSTLFDDIIDKAQFDPKCGEVRFQNESKNAIALSQSRARTRQKSDNAIRGAKNLSALAFENEPVTDDTDTGSPITLYNFLSFCIQEYPADHYIVVLSGHAGGTESDYLLKDESSRGSLTFNELKQVFQRLLQKDLGGHPIDIVGMDNCLMSMGEICYEFRDLAQIVVGCESYSPASGWPYRQILERLKHFTKPKSTKTEIQVEAAKAIVEEYVNYYSSYWVAGLSVTQSALDVRHVVELRERVDQLAVTLDQELKKACDNDGRSQSSFKDDLVLAHWEAQSYNGEWFVDLFDFCDCLQRRTSSADVFVECQKLREFIATKFVLRSCYSGAGYQYSYGVSIYFPWSSVSSRYQNLDFIKDSPERSWLSFLKTYTDVTRRRPRGYDALLVAAAAGNLHDDSSGTAQMGMGEMRMGEMRMGEMRMGEMRMGEMRMGEMRMGEMRMGEMRMGEMRMGEMRMGEMRMGEMRMGEMRMSDVRMGEMRMGEMRMGEMRMTGGEGKNPIHSMRNPPVVFFPPSCIAEDKKVIEGVREFFAPLASSPPKQKKKRSTVR